MEIKKVQIQRDENLRQLKIQRKLGLKEYQESIERGKSVLEKIRNGEDY